MDIQAEKKEKSFDGIYRINRITSFFLILSILLILSNIPRSH